MNPPRAIGRVKQVSRAMLRGNLALLFLAFGLCVVGIAGIAFWSMTLDFKETRNGLLQVEVNRLRSHAIRTTMRIQDEFQHITSPQEGLDKADAEWLRRHWDRTLPTDDSHLYAAVVDQTGQVLKHSTKSLEGGALAHNWYQRQMPDAGEDVVETSSPELTGGITAYDLSIPVLVGSKQIATYHSGLNTEWFERRLTQVMATTRQRWIVTTLLIVVVVGLACYSAISIAKRVSDLQTALAVGRVKQLAELGQVAGGIAHEIRNPLNAVRINLHVIERAWLAHAARESQPTEIVTETIEEIGRVEGMLRTLLEYAKPEEARAELVDVGVEVRSLLTFMGPLLDRDEIKLAATLPTEPALAFIDRTRLRQVMLNLLTNAAEAVGPHGQVRISVATDGETLKLQVSDTGPGVPEELREAIFEPFFSTKHLGTGLGLALVRRFVEEAWGTIHCQDSAEGGAEFCVNLPTNAKQVSDPLQVSPATLAAATQLLSVPMLISIC
ncbi:MAG: hypothetical protein JSS27_01955 [Planctomycetes bacterium]|nr:hypothetical protein [Planctomycetota bacterium]